MSLIKLSLISNGALADGTTANTVSALVTDATGVALAGQNVTFTAAGTPAIITPEIATTDANGIVTAAVVSIAFGQIGVVATLDDGTADTIILDFAALPLADNGVAADGVKSSVDAPVVTSAVKDLVGGLRAGIEDLEKVIDTVSAVGLLPAEELEALGKKLFGALLQKFQ
jgi:adhesin/invasin